MPELPLDPEEPDDAPLLLVPDVPLVPELPLLLVPEVLDELPAVLLSELPGAGASPLDPTSPTVPLGARPSAT